MNIEPSNNNDTASTTVGIEVVPPNDDRWVDSETSSDINLEDGVDELSEKPDIESGSNDGLFVSAEPDDDLCDVNLNDDADGLTEKLDIETDLSDDDLNASEPSYGHALDETEKSDIETGSYDDDDSTTFEIEAKEELEISRIALFASLCANNELDARLGRRASDFALARSERARKAKPPCMIFSTEVLIHLGDIRSDIQWAEDAAWRRENHQPYVSWEDFGEKRKQMSWKFPYLTIIILISHFVMMLYEFHLSDWTPAPLKENKMFGPSGDVLFRAGAMNTLDMVENGSWYRLLTQTFLHSGVIHYLLNDLGICCLASVLERNHGMAFVALVYFLPSFAASVLSALLNPGTIAVGASGGFFALLGAAVADILVNWNLMFLVFKDRPGISKRCLQLKCACGMFVEVFGQLCIGLISMVDNFAHLGGFIYGFLVAYVVLERLPLAFFGTENGCCSKCRSLMFRFLAAAVAVSAIAVSSVNLSQSDGTTIPYPVINDHINNVF